MGELKKEIFVCIDCETTGLDPDKDKIIEIAAVCFSWDQCFARFETLIDPECDIPDESIAIHGINSSLLAGKPKIHEVLSGLFKCMDSYTIVGHGVGFDIEMIARAAKGAQIECHFHMRPFIDTLRLARHYGESLVNSLAGLAKHFHITYDETHRAMADVMLNIEVFKHLTRRFRSKEEILKILARPIQMKTMPLGKHKGRPFSEIPSEYLQWAAKMDFDEDLVYSIRNELGRRNRGGRFNQIANPFLKFDWHSTKEGQSTKEETKNNNHGKKEHKRN